MQIRILAGPSGSGKSTHIAKTELLEAGGRCLRLNSPPEDEGGEAWYEDHEAIYGHAFYSQDVVILSADDITFDAEGNFNFKLLGNAHALCIRTFTRILQLEDKERPSVLIVDNTNTSPWEIAPYVALAMTCADVVLEVLVFEKDWQECLNRNSHGTPAHAVRQQARRLSRTMDEWPAYWPRPTFVKNTDQSE